MPIISTLVGTKNMKRRTKIFLLLTLTLLIVGHISCFSQSNNETPNLPPPPPPPPPPITEEEVRLKNEVDSLRNDRYIKFGKFCAKLGVECIKSDTLKVVLQVIISPSGSIKEFSFPKHENINQNISVEELECLHLKLEDKNLNMGEIKIIPNARNGSEPSGSGITTLISQDKYAYIKRDFAEREPIITLDCTDCTLEKSFYNIKTNDTLSEYFDSKVKRRTISKIDFNGNVSSEKMYNIRNFLEKENTYKYDNEQRLKLITENFTLSPLLKITEIQFDSINSIWKEISIKRMKKGQFRSKCRT